MRLETNRSQNALAVQFDTVLQMKQAENWKLLYVYSHSLNDTACYGFIEMQ